MRFTHRLSHDVVEMMHPVVWWMRRHSKIRKRWKRTSCLTFFCTFRVEHSKSYLETRESCFLSSFEFFLLLRFLFFIPHSIFDTQNYVAGYHRGRILYSWRRFSLSCPFLTFFRLYRSVILLRSSSTLSHYHIFSIFHIPVRWSFNKCLQNIPKRSKIPNWRLSTKGRYEIACRKYQNV